MKGNLASLRPVGELAAGRPCGDRLRYLAGCRCAECRRANTDYEKARAIAHKAGDWNGFVSAARARAHIEALAAAGVGRRQVADASKVADTVVAKIKTGKKIQIRARTERLILGVTLDAMADHALVDAAAIWALINDLLATGYTKAAIALELGYATPALQIRPKLCTLRTAYDVRQVYSRLRRVPAKRAQAAIAALRDEGYRLDRIMAMALDLASRSGIPAIDLDVHGGKWISAAAAELFVQLHEELTACPA